MSSGLEAFAKEFAGSFWVASLSAGEDIDGGVKAFGPGVDRKVGFREQGQRRHALGGEAVRDFFEQAGSGHRGGIFERPADKLVIIEQRDRAIVEFEQAVDSSGFQKLSVRLGVGE